VPFRLRIPWRAIKERAKCVHYYHYFHHRDFGLCYVRVQSWFPFTVRVGLNGRHWLCQQLQQQGVAFQRQDNLLVAVADAALAQQLLDAQAHAPWPRLLCDLVQPVQPLWDYLHQTVHTPYYWTTEQSEWATDYVFRSPQELARWYPRWLHYGIETLQCPDVLRYLGKKEPHPDLSSVPKYSLATGLPSRNSTSTKLRNIEFVASLGFQLVLSAIACSRVR
jgi:hypothetical protein